MAYQRIQIYALMVFLANCTGITSSSTKSNSNATESKLAGDKKPKKPKFGAPDLEEQDTSALNPTSTNTSTGPKSDKALKVQRVGFYRALYVDLRRQDWGTYDAIGEGFAAVDAGFRFSKLDTPDPTPSTLNNMSVYQPLVDSATTSSTGPELFHSLGFAAVAGVDTPNFPTVIATPLADPDALAAPEDYELIFQMQGPSIEDINAGCLPTAPHSSQIFCSEFFSGTSANSLNIERTGSITNAEQDYRLLAITQKSNLFVWRPKPPKGYRCLGDITTSSSAKPDTQDADPNNGVLGYVSDFQAARDMTKIFGNSAVNTLSSQDWSVYCVKEAYLTPGTIGPRIAYNNTRKVGFYKVVPVDAKVGYEGSGLFLTIAEKIVGGKTVSLPDQASEMLKNNDLWVLKKDALLTLPDVTLNGK